MRFSVVIPARALPDLDHQDPGEEGVTGRINLQEPLNSSAFQV